MGAFGEALRRFRRAANLTQQEIANRTGVSNTYISALESGRKNAPPRAIVTALAACLGVKESELWSLARNEREARLRARINGVPTSRRVPRTPAPSAVEDVGLAPELDRALHSLSELATTPEKQRRLAKAIETLTAALREES